MAAKEEQISRE